MKIITKLREIAEKLPPEKSESSEEQGAPAPLPPAPAARICRLLLTITCALIVAWEVVGRPLLTAIFPNAELPPSILSDAFKMLITLALGL